MKFQNVYKAENLDFEATYEKISSIIPGTDRTRAGRKPQLGVGPISFKLPPAKIPVLIFPKGPPHKIQVAWTDEREKEIYLLKLESLLVPIEGKRITLTPLHMNILYVPHPGPKKLIFAWCKEKVIYVKQIGSKYFGLVFLFLAFFFAFAFFMLLRMLPTGSQYMATAQNFTEGLLEIRYTFKLLPWVAVILAAGFSMLAFREWRRIKNLARILLAYF